VALEMIIGAAAMAFLFLYFAFQLDGDHFLLKLLLIFFFCFSIYIIPNAVINNNCDIVQVNQTVAGGLTTYQYDEVCNTNTTNTEDSLLNIALWFFRIFVIYFSVYLFYHWAKSSETFMQWFEGRR
jgi:ABC-type branched-subunit amino acid transport system permease subunit